MSLRNREARDGRSGQAPVSGRAAGQSRKRPRPSLVTGPSLRAAAFLPSSEPAVKQLLTERQRHQLLAIAACLRLPPRTQLYEAQRTASSIWIIESGVVKSYRDLRSGRRQVMGFLMAGDIFGLAENGLYVNSTRSVTDLVLYRLPAVALADVLRRDPDLEFQFLCKVVHEMRVLQRRCILVGRRDAAGRVAMCIDMLARSEHASAAEIPLPMKRSDIADYLNLTPEAVSRASRQLVRSGIIAFPHRHAVRILDRTRFNRLVQEG
jgi:CRP-like cAMP-binding protein